MSEAVFIGLGSNADPVSGLRAGCRMLAERFGGLRASAVHASPPAGARGEEFLNMAVVLLSGESIEAVAAALRHIERRAGRVRGVPEVRLDLDLLLFGNRISASPPATPRGDVLQHGFVLGPLAELAPALVHPVDGRSLALLWWHWRLDHAGMVPRRLGPLETLQQDV